MTLTTILPKFTKPADSRISNASGSSSSIILSFFNDFSGSQITTSEISPAEIMTNIKESCMYFLKNDTEFVKQIFSEYVKNNPEVVRQILSESINQTNNDEEIIFRSVDKTTAKKEIQDYIKNNQGCLTSQIIEDLRLEPLLVMEILKELREQNLVENKSIE